VTVLEKKFPCFSTVAGCCCCSGCHGNSQCHGNALLHRFNRMPLPQRVTAACPTSDSSASESASGCTAFLSVSSHARIIESRICQKNKKK
jgi:hypothetical protein